MTTITTEKPLAAGEVANLLTPEFISSTVEALKTAAAFLEARYPACHWCYVSMNNSGLYASITPTGGESISAQYETFEAMLASLDKQLNPVSMAATKRANAQKLLDEASALENAPR